MAWCGGYEVKAKPQSELYSHGAYGAFVNVVVDCKSESEFRERASHALIEDHFEILGIEDVTEVDLSDIGLPESEIELISEQLMTGNVVAYGEFQTYPRDGLDA